MNTIAKRISDFLKGFPPFDMLTKEQLFSVSEAVEVGYLKKGDSLFKINETIENYFYVVKDGAIGLYTAESQIINECDEGDIFGLRALLRKDNYKLEARAIEESVVLFPKIVITSYIKILRLEITPPYPEIICVQNVSTKVVCEIIFFN